MIESIRAAGYELCKSVKLCEQRPDIQGVIRDLTVSSGPPMAPGDRSMFGYVARRQRAQAAGYLATDQYRDRMAEQPLGPPPALDEGERALLAGLHREFMRIDATCTDSLLPNDPVASRILDPYNRMPPVSADGAAPVTLCDTEVLDTLALRFASHAAAAVARGVQLPDGSDGVDRMIDATHALEVHLQETGPLEAPRDVFMVLAERLGSPQRDAMRRVSAFLCLRASLAVLNQMVFQALLADKLPALTLDNTISVDRAVDHAVSGGWKIFCQLDEVTSGVDCGDLALLVGLPGLQQTSQLVSVERMMTSIAGDVGATIELEAREIDDDLSPYGHLLI